MEGEGEPAEITQIKRDLRTAADANIAVGEWLTSAMSASWEVATALLDIPELADLLGERHRIIANDWHAASMSALAGRVLHRAVDILDHVEFTPAALRADLADRARGAGLVLLRGGAHRVRRRSGERLGRARARQRAEVAGVPRPHARPGRWCALRLRGPVTERRGR